MPSPKTRKNRARADRIPYNYLRSRDPLILRRLAYSGLVLLATFAWIGWGWFHPEVGRLRESHGPLSRVHATWEARCDACHVTPPSIQSLLGFASSKWDGLASTAGDQKCLSCHMGSARHAHHADLQRPGRIPHCVQCHSEHQGKSFSLVGMNDGQCTQCHANLDAVRNGPAQVTKMADRIKRFDDGTHPDFRFRRTPMAQTKVPVDPGKLKFNHALHLMKGLRFSLDDEPLVTFNTLPRGDRSRYGWKPDSTLTEPVELNCASCHHMEGESDDERPNVISLREVDHEPASSRLFRQKTPGAYPSPISYANDCSACHPINIASQSHGDQIDVQHGLQPPELLAMIEARMFKTLLADAPELRKELETFLVPGQPPQPKRLGIELDRRVEAASRILLGTGKATCTECHYYQDSGGKVRPEPEFLSDRTALTIAAPEIPEIWMKHGRFDHASHRAVNCMECHVSVMTSGSAVSTSQSGGTRTRVDGSPTWKSHEDVLLPGIDNCIKCHAPQRQTSKETSGGASFNCTECHLYHNRDGLTEGIAQQVGRNPLPPDAQDQRDIQRFLKGR